MSDTVWEFRLRVPTDECELAADRLWAAGARGVQVVEGDGKLTELRAVLGGSEAGSREAFGPLREGWACDLVEVSTIAADDWKRFARPITIDSRLVVAPTWWSEPIEGDADSDMVVIRIDPGPAFGLGDHPTTQLSLGLLRDCSLTDAEVLDVGTGTGVLAIYAARVGAERVVGIDVSAVSVTNAAENAERNEVDVELSTIPLADLDKQFDVVVANILAPTLIGLSADLVRVLRPGGVLIISGVLAGGFDHVVDALSPLEVAETRLLDGWAGVRLTKPVGGQ